MRSNIWRVVICVMLIVSALLPGSYHPVAAETPQPGTPMVTGTPGLDTTVVVFPYDVNLFGIYLVHGDVMTPVTSVPVEHVNIDNVTATLSPDGLKVAYLVKHGSTGFSKLVVIGVDGYNSKTIFESEEPDSYITSFVWSHDSLKVSYSLSADQSVLPEDRVSSFENPASEVNPLDETVLPDQQSRYTGEVWSVDIMSGDSQQLVDSGAQKVLGWSLGDTGIIFSQYSAEVTVASDPAVASTSAVAVPDVLPAGVSIVALNAASAADMNNVLSFPHLVDVPVYYDVVLLETETGAQKLAAFSTTSDFQTTPSGPTTLSLADLNVGSGNMRIPGAATLIPVLTSDDAISSLSLSPDGSHLAYATEKLGALWTADINGGNQKQVVGSGVSTNVTIHWNAANTGVTAQKQAADRSQEQITIVAAADGSQLGTLAAQPSPGLLADASSSRTVVNYSVPFVHQKWDISNWIDGWCACGPTSTVMALAYYQKLAPHPMTVNKYNNWAHNTDYGYYIAEKFSPYETPRFSSGGCPTGYGVYGQVIKDGNGGREWIDAVTTNYGINGTWLQYQATFGIIQNALNRGHLVIVGSKLTTGGHIILVKGYTSDGKLIVNDPYGNKVAGSYGKNVYDGMDAYYDWDYAKISWYIELEAVNGLPPFPQWRADYFNNKYLAGTPGLSRNDSSIDFNWGTGSPAGGVPADEFSVRWTRTLYFERGAYRFTVGADDGVRLWIDSKLVIDKWFDQGLTNYSTGDLFLTGGAHSIKMEYYENGGGAAAKLSWQRVDTLWIGDYYNNRNLSGSPVFSRNDDSGIYFNWGNGGPGNGVGNDNFSVRWTKKLNVTRAGKYRIFARADDGVRVWVDGNRLIDSWRDQAPTTYASPIFDLSSGQHDFKVEYYENGGGAFMHLVLEPVFYAEYYTNRNLSGNRAWADYTTNINYNWGLFGPRWNLWNNFSVRWTGGLSLSGGNYTFCTRTDDGVRLYVDGTLYINQWRDMGSTTYCASRYLSKGFHDLKMEYYENGGGAVAQFWWNRQGDPNALAAASVQSKSMLADITDDDVLALYNDHGYLGPLVEGDTPNLSYPRVFLPILTR